MKYIWSHDLRTVYLVLLVPEFIFWEFHRTFHVLTLASLNLPAGAEALCDELLVLKVRVLPFSFSRKI
jgi:hypothetical protein